MSEKTTLEEITREINEGLKQYGSVCAKLNGLYILVDCSDTFGVITGSQIDVIIDTCRKYKVLYLFSTHYQKPIIKITLSI